MEIFAQNTILGTLKVLEVYEYYDGPRLFASVNDAGSIFLTLWTQSFGPSDEYYIQPMSIRAFRKVRAGEWALRDAFTGIEGIQPLIMRVDRASDESQIVASTNGNLNPAFLPLEGEFLDILAPLPLAAIEVDVEQRNLVELSTGSHLSFSALSKILDSFERLINLALQGSSRRRRKLQLDISFAAVGSFVVGAVLPKPRDESEERNQVIALELVMDAFGEDRTEDVDRLRATTAFQTFAQAVSKSTDELRISWSSSRRDEYRSVTFSRAQAELVYSQVKRETREYWAALAADNSPRIEITDEDRSMAQFAPQLVTDEQTKAGYFLGVFKAVDLERNRFAVYHTGTDGILRGVIGEAAHLVMQTVTLNMPYIVRISSGQLREPILEEARPVSRLGSSPVG